MYVHQRHTKKVTNDLLKRNVKSVQDNIKKKIYKNDNDNGFLVPKCI